jgi:hypothetical protein
MATERVKALFGILLASALSIIYVPFPDITGDIVYYLVKRSARIIENDESNRQQVCEGVQPEGEDACSVVEENEPCDGENGPNNTDESVGNDQREPYGGKDE